MIKCRFSHIKYERRGYSVAVLGTDTSPIYSFSNEAWISEIFNELFGKTFDQTKFMRYNVVISNIGSYDV